jgi:carbamoyltransferase
MRVLGVSYGYHDASACLVEDGRIVAASAEERFTRQKHDANFPTFAIEHCLEKAGLRSGDLDQVVFHEDPHAKFSRVLTASLAPFPASRREFVNSMKSWLGRKLWSLNTISARLDVDADRISYFSHHYSHAVQAFMGSGFDDAAILIVDAVGDWACTAMFKGRWIEGRPEVTRVLEIAFPNSLGLVYSAYTAYLGFNPNDSECSTMALAAFGTPRYAEKIREIIAPLDDGTYEVDQRYFHFTSFYKGAVTEKFIEAFGPARTSRFKLPQSCFGAREEISADAQRFADVAASIQLVLEERILQLCEKLRAEVDSKNLCYAGGVSLNCVANYKILSRGLFENVFIPPDPGDGGTSVGTALAYSASNATYEPAMLKYGPYLGSDFDESDDVRMIEYVKPEHVRQYLKRGLKDSPATAWKHQTFSNEDELIAEVTRRLVDKQIVGWCQARAEIGPRALGNRSILIRPDDVEIALRLSRLVKDRALYRPYAFSITAEDAARVLDVPEAHLQFNRWMQYAVPVKSEVSDRVVAALHIDRTTRAQVCYPSDNPRYHALLKSIGSATGLGVLLNTSFNAGGYPIVSNGVEALVMFARTDMDALVLNNTLVWKR